MRKYYFIKILIPGLLNGPMLKKFSCRQVGVFGAILLFAGTLLTSMAVTMSYFVVSFGIIFGKLYFLKKK
jgi:hypothetical protein